MNDKKRAARRLAAFLGTRLAPDRIKTDPLYTHAWSGDASYFRLVPALVVIVETEDEVRHVLAGARSCNLGVTFRAAGTSLSGQAVTDEVLCVLGDGWDFMDIAPAGTQATLGPGVILAQANTALKPHHMKIGPDPASINACKIGGVVANNSSGMCCGVARNTYHTMQSIRLILGDGTVLDSGDPASRRAFVAARPDIVTGLKELAEQVQRDNALVDLIKNKYAIKNTVGYSLNALIDFSDPIDILAHLMVGSEGTLGFISSITYNCVPDHPFKATALVPFDTNHRAARGVQALHEVGVSAAEFMERKALSCVEHLPAMAPFRPLLSDTSPAVLIEIMARDAKKLDQEIRKAVSALEEVGTLSTPRFTTNEEQQQGLWDVRKSLFAFVGTTRPKGSIMLSEDAAVPIHRLADAVNDLRALLDRHGYHEGVIFGHALDGNLHFQMQADFTSQEERTRFEHLTADLADLISLEYQGSLKAEHGTGRAIAPFVKQEWGEKAYGLMHRIKKLIDPDRLLNPGVMLNDDPRAHIRNTKHMAASDELIDLCIECGLCESVCPSAGLTLTPRQRIAVSREKARLEESRNNADLLATLGRDFVHAGLDTCAGCNLCAINCPIGIETGTLVLKERSRSRGRLAKAAAGLAASATPALESLIRGALRTQQAARATLGDGPVEKTARALNRISGGRFPKPGKTLAAGPGTPQSPPLRPRAPRGTVTYFPACASRMFATPRTALDLLPVTDAMLVLLQRAGFNPVLPEKLKGICCGQPFASRGFEEQAKRSAKKLQDRLDAAGPAGQTIVTDMSTCTLHMRKNAMTVIDSIEFLSGKVAPHLTLTRPLQALALHHNCSARHLGEQQAMEHLAALCAREVHVLNSVTCCGYAGDKGMFFPQLNAHALRHARNDPPRNCTLGISSVATCAVGLSEHLRIPFASPASVLEYVTRPR